MVSTDARANVAESIENAIVSLSDALIDLDRISVYDKATIGSFAHLMNNYLSVSEGTLGLIAQSLGNHPDPELGKWLEGLRHLGNLMHYAVARLLRVSPPSEFPLKFEHVNLPVLMKRASEYHRLSAEQKQLRIVCRSVGDVPLAWADRVALAVVADNLLSNAVKFSNPGGEIVVETASGPAAVVCSVRQHGPGLTLEQTQLFDQHASDQSLRYSLTIAKELVDRMGGKVWSENEPGRGACVSFRVPYQPSGSSEAPRLA